MTISEEDWGFIQGYAYAVSSFATSLYDLGTLIPDIIDDDDALLAQVREEVARRLQLRADRQHMLAEALDRKADELQFGKAATAMRMWPHKLKGRRQ
jgi:heme exporter protein D